MVRRSPRTLRIMRPVLILLAVLATLDLLLAGWILVGWPAPPEWDRRVAAGRQAGAMEAQADRARHGWTRFRQRLEERASEARR